MGAVAALLGDGDGNVESIRLEFQNDLHSGNIVFTAIKNGILTGGKDFCVGGIGGPFGWGFEIEVV